MSTASSAWMAPRWAVDCDCYCTPFKHRFYYTSPTASIVLFLIPANRHGFIKMSNSLPGDFSGTVIYWVLMVLESSALESNVQTHLKGARCCSLSQDRQLMFHRVYACNYCICVCMSVCVCLRVRVNTLCLRIFLLEIRGGYFWWAWCDRGSRHDWRQRRALYRDGPVTHMHAPHQLWREEGLNVKWEKQMTEWEECVVGEITRAAKTEKCEARWTRSSEKCEGPIGAKQGRRVCIQWSPSVREPFVMVNLATVPYHTALDRYLIAKFNYCVTHTHWLLPFPNSSLCIGASQKINYYTTLLIDRPLICSPLVLFNRGSWVI